MVYAPLWQDIYFETSAYTVLNYSVRTSNTTGTTQYIIYKGKAYSQPNLGMISIKMNPICEKYMGNQLPEGWLGGQDFGYNPVGLFVEFYLFDDDTETVLESYSLRYTYDEDFKWDGTLTGSSQTSGLRKIDEITSGGSKHLYAPNQYTFDTSIYISTWVNYIKKVPALVNVCKGDYAVYYLGRCGCWNDFLFTGVCKRTDEFTHYDYGTNGYNTLSGNPEYSATIIRYCNEAKTKFECTTGWLNDANSEKFAQDLIPSIQVMLHDLKRDKIYPAVIEDTSVETKKFLNNKEMNQYTVTFRIARDYYIR